MCKIVMNQCNNSDLFQMCITTEKQKAVYEVVEARTNARIFYLMPKFLWPTNFSMTVYTIYMYDNTKLKLQLKITL